MAGQAASGGFNLLGWIAGGMVAAAVGAGALYYSGVLGPVPEPVAETPAINTSSPATSVATSPTTDNTAAQDSPSADPALNAALNEAETASQPDAVPALQAPQFDVVRVDADGNTVIAGKGHPGSQITIFMDNGEQTSTMVDQGGSFVSLLTISPSSAARILTLVAELDGQKMPSDDQIILAPTPMANPEPAAEIAQADIGAAEAPQTAAAQTSLVSEPAPEPLSEPKTALAVAEPTPVADTEGSQTDASQPDTALAVEVETSDAVAPMVAEATEVASKASADAADEAADVPDVQAVEVATTPPAPVTATQAASSLTTGSQSSTQVASVDPTSESVAPTDMAPTTEGTAVSVAEAAPKVATVTNVNPAAATEPQADPETGAASETTSEPTTQTTQTAEKAPATPAATAQEPAPATQVTVLRAGKDGVELLQSGTPTPKVQDKIALDTISYSEEGDVLLSGRAQGQSVVRVYLDNTAVADLVTRDDGRWSGKVEGIEPGIYTLRLDELGGAGDVLSRLETPFKREAPEALRPAQTASGEALEDTPLIRAVTVQQGDTLWAISRERYGDGVLYVRVFEANKGDIRNPDLIYPGQVFSLPD